MRVADGATSFMKNVAGFQVFWRCHMIWQFMNFIIDWNTRQKRSFELARGSDLKYYATWEGAASFRIINFLMEWWMFVKSKAWIDLENHYCFWWIKVIIRTTANKFWYILKVMNKGYVMPRNFWCVNELKWNITYSYVCLSNLNMFRTVKQIDLCRKTFMESASEFGCISFRWINSECSNEFFS